MYEGTYNRRAESQSRESLESPPPTKRSATVSVLPSATGWSLEDAHCSPQRGASAGFDWRGPPARVPHCCTPSRSGRSHWLAVQPRPRQPTLVLTAILLPWSHPLPWPYPPRYSRSGSRLTPDPTLSPPSSTQHAPLGNFTVGCQKSGVDDESVQYQPRSASRVDRPFCPFAHNERRIRPARRRRAVGLDCFRQPPEPPLPIQHTAPAHVCCCCQSSSPHGAHETGSRRLADTHRYGGRPEPPKLYCGLLAQRVPPLPLAFPALSVLALASLTFALAQPT